MFSHRQQTLGTQSRQYDQVQSWRDPAIDSWQLEDALNALKQSESALSGCEQRHAREQEQLHTTIAAFEHSAKQREDKIQQLTEQLESVQATAAEKIEIARQAVDDSTAGLQQERLQHAAEIKKYRHAVGIRNEKIASQLVLLEDLNRLCDQREAEVTDAGEVISRQDRELKTLRHQLADQSGSLKQTIADQSRQLQQQQRTLATLEKQCAEQDSDLTAALRLCDETESKLIRSTQSHAHERARLEHLVSRLQGTARQHETRVNELEQVRETLEQELTIRLSDLNQESVHKIAEAEQKYESQLGNLKSTIDELESVASSRASEVQNLSSKIVQLEHEYTNKIALAEASIEKAVESVKGEQSAEVQRLQSVIGSLEQAFESTVADKQNIEAEVSKTKQEADQLRQQCESLQQQSQQVQQDKANKIKGLEESIRAHQERIKAEKLKEAKQLKVQVKQLTEQLAEEENSSVHVRHEVKRLAQRLSKHLAYHANVKDHLHRRIAELQRDLQRLTTQRAA